MGTVALVPDTDSGHFACPFCNSYDVNRLYIAGADVDSCDCSSCGARWDQERSSGKYLGRSDRQSILARRPPR